MFYSCFCGHPTSFPAHPLGARQVGRVAQIIHQQRGGAGIVSPHCAKIQMSISISEK